MNLDAIVRAPNGGLISQGDAASAINAANRFNVVVFCAEEFQPEPVMVQKSAINTRVVLAPNDDSVLTPKQAFIASAAAIDVATAYEKGQRILVTCMAGRNRSGLVTALALCMIYGISGQEAAVIVQKNRKGANALTNPDFMKHLKKIPRKKAGPVTRGLLR